MGNIFFNNKSFVLSEDLENAFYILEARFTLRVNDPFRMIDDRSIIFERQSYYKFDGIA